MAESWLIYCLRQARLWSPSIGLLAIIAFAGIFVSSCFRSDQNTSATDPERIKTRAMSPTREIDTPSSTRQWNAALSMTPQLPATPSPFPTPKISIIFFPVAQKSGTSAIYQARLPLVIKPDSNLAASFKEKTILVDLSDQHVYAYDKGKLIYSFVASTGRKNLTRPGQYRILDKNPNAYSDPWGFWMPHWMGIYYAGYNLENGFHSLPVLSNGSTLWGDKIGAPITYGCVVLMPNDMKKLYRWAGVGTAVVIQR